jgi:hypothetical protein
MKAEVRRILTAYSNATGREVAEGAVWYPNARELAYELAEEYVMGAGVLAALSPQLDWDRTVQLARDAFADHFHGQVSDAIGKARRFMQGFSVDEVLPRGKKTWHFAHTILNPETTEHVVIDRHAADIAEGMVRGSEHRRMGAPRYRSLAADYLEAARITGRPVSEIQAITWVAHRNHERVGGKLTL